MNDDDDDDDDEWLTIWLPLLIALMLIAMVDWSALK